MRNGFRLGSIGGIEVYADWSLLIIFSLIAVSLGSGVLPRWHPEWSAGLIWTTALAAAVLFFASVLAHELSHALVGRRAGIRIPRITLFVFGGMAHMETEPPSWGSELRMAIVGPLTSLALGAACLWLGGALAAPALPEDATTLEPYMAALSPAATVLLWLGSINIVLGVFNLVPGFPLDGGRVLRAAAWGVTGDFTRATRVASTMGQAVGWALMAAGFAMVLGVDVPVFGTGVVGGLWLVLIGWFLSNAAAMAFRQVRLREALADTPVSRLMQTDVVRIAPELPVAALIDQHVVPSGHSAFAVERDGRLLGIVTLSDLRRLDRSRWDRATVGDIMTRASQMATVAARQPASEALDRLAQRGVNQLPVLDGARLVGLVSRDALLRWFSFHQHHGQDRAGGRGIARRAS